MKTTQLCLFLLHACMSWSMPIKTHDEDSSVSTSSIDNQFLTEAKRSVRLTKMLIDNYIRLQMPNLEDDSKPYLLLKDMARLSSQYLSIQRRMQVYNDSDIDSDGLQATSEVMKHTLQATCNYIKSLPNLEAYDCSPEVLQMLDYRDAISQLRDALPAVISNQGSGLDPCIYLIENIYCDNLIPGEVKETIRSLMNKRCYQPLKCVT